MARLYMDRNRDQDAADALQGVIDSGADDTFRNLARLRLARIYLYQEKPQEAVALLEGQPGDAFSASYDEVLGDAYAMLDRIDEAEAAYQRVLADPLAQGTVDLRLLQWKLLDLAQKPAVSELTDEPADTETVESGEAVEESE